MINEKDIIQQLKSTRTKLRSAKFRALLAGEPDAIRIKHRDLVWELSSIIREIDNKKLNRNLGDLPKFNNQYKSSIKKLEKSLKGMQKMKTTLKNVEEFAGLATRIFMLFA